MIAMSVLMLPWLSVDSLTRATPPGYADPATGTWLMSAIDFSEDGLLITRTHTAGQRGDPVRANERVLGPGWQLQPLGGMLGNRLHDHSDHGFVVLDLASGTESRRYLADPSRPEAFVHADGLIVRNSDDTFTQTDETGLIVTWSRVHGHLLPTSVGLADGDFQSVTYDAHRRVRRLISPAAPGADCRKPDPASCSTATLVYADRTTATPSALGEVTGLLGSIDYDAAGDTPPVTALTYRYDASGHLRQVRDLRRPDKNPERRFVYAYSTDGDITKMTTTEEGSWHLTYSSPGTLANAARRTIRLGARACPTPYAADYMLRGMCKTSVDVRQGASKVMRPPFWKATLTGGSVMGITNDGCSAPIVGNKPTYWLDFRAACDSHDYGYGLIRNRLNGDRNGLDRSQRTHVDAVFLTIMKERICAAITGTVADPFRGTQSSKRSICLSYANTFYKAVRAKGDGAL
ncbi:hypothetical protein GCM10009850_111340 [Nonomuraea monospora]|uniref:Uncharacterized protein n=2 Tax=Nonomuraea monospora TaxID=568818 RepID=A0ABN3D1K0_9ACTN